MNKIEPFVEGGYSGNIFDVSRIRDEIEDRLIEQMRERGYLPVLELDSELETNYSTDTELLYWTITVHGRYVGPKKAKEYEGLWQNKPIGTLRSKPAGSLTT